MNMERMFVCENCYETFPTVNARLLEYLTSEYDTNGDCIDTAIQDTEFITYFCPSCGEELEPIVITVKGDVLVEVKELETGYDVADYERIKKIADALKLKISNKILVSCGVVARL